MDSLTVYALQLKIRRVRQHFNLADHRPATGGPVAFRGVSGLRRRPCHGAQSKGADEYRYRNQYPWSHNIPSFTSVSLLLIRPRIRHKQIVNVKWSQLPRNILVVTPEVLCERLHLDVFLSIGE